MFFLKKCCKGSTPKQVKKNALNRIFETKRWETHAFFDGMEDCRIKRCGF